jgi:hypothetical protein
VLVMVVGTIALIFGAARGNSSVTSLTSPAQVSESRLQNAYYRCLDVQTHSLVSVRQPVTMSHWWESLDVLRAAGIWLKAASPSNTSVPQLRTISTRSPASCHGTVVEGRFQERGGKVRERVGTGASVPGEGPLPRPQL